nr:TetR/AcrR family transcriptional regulator [Caldimonas sp.]
MTRSPLAPRKRVGAVPKRRQSATPALPPVAMRAQILAVAARQFSERGYATTTLRTIADAAGIKAGSIYYHFQGKDEIAAGVLDAGIEAISEAVRARLDALPARADARTRLAAAVTGHLWGMLHHGEFTAAHIRIYRYVSDAARRRHEPVRVAYTSLWDGLLGGAAAAGGLRRDVPVKLVRQFLIGALNWPVDWYDAGRGNFDEFAAQMTAMVCDGIVAAASPARPSRPKHAGAQRRGAETRA